MNTTREDFKSKTAHNDCQNNPIDYVKLRYSPREARKGQYVGYTIKPKGREMRKMSSETIDLTLQQMKQDIKKQIIEFEELSKKTKIVTKDEAFEDWSDVINEALAAADVPESIKNSKTSIICSRIMNNKNERQPNEYTVFENDDTIIVTNDFIYSLQCFVNRLI